VILTLRPYQKQAIINVRDAFRGGARGVLLASPTGSGKTAIFSFIAEQAGKRGKNILILVHRQELLSQCSRALSNIGVDHGLIAPGRTQTLDHVQVASVQTLVRRLGEIIYPDMIICDEAHHMTKGGSSWGKVAEYYPRALLLGVTATPARLDGKPLGRGAGGFFDMLVQGPTVKELIALGFLSPPVTYIPPSKVDMSGVHTKFGDYNLKEVSERVDKPQIIGDAVEHYLRICPGQPAIAFCMSIKHAEHVAQMFRDAGVIAESIDGKLDDRTRKYRIDALGNGRIQVLTSCEIISEGTDIPVVTTAILLRPTQSLGLCLQQCGRILRPHPDKPFSIILDHVGNIAVRERDGSMHMNHGFVEDDRDWSLDSGVIQPKHTSNGGTSDRFRQCLKCYAIFSPALSRCPQCGSPWVADEREIRQVDGELVKIDPVADGMEFHLKQLQEEQERRARQLEVVKADSLEALLKIAKARGYKSAWAYRMWAIRQARMKGKAVRENPDQSNLFA
jgi:superfamily II DNA or RNA helicase